MNEQSVFSLKTKKVLRAPKWKVLRLLTRVENFAKFMPNVKQCMVIEKGRASAITQWSVEVDGIPFTWKEKDVVDIKNFVIRFHAIEGDLEYFEGEWRLVDHPPGGTEVTVTVAVKIGIPIVEQVIGNVVAEKLKKNFDGMLQAAEEALTTRRYKNIADRRSSDIRGFAVIGHPYNLNHLIKYFKFFKPDLALPSKEFLLKIFEITPSYRSYDIQEFRAASGKYTHGYFIMCPIIPDMLDIRPDKVVEKVAQACRVAEGLSVGIVALGGFTSIAGEKQSRALSNTVNVPLTTGNTFTVGLVLEGVTKAAQWMEIDLPKAKVAVLGGGGDIGGACARLLCEKASEVVITGRNERTLMEAERSLSYAGRARVKTSLDNNSAVRDADIVIAAASAANSIVDFASFKPGAVICDVGYPKNLSYTMSCRNDVFVFSGGLTRVPGEFDLGFDIGLPSTRILYGCFAEAIILDLEERYENFSWGKGNITREKVDYIMNAAKKHGLELAPFFWGIRLMTQREVEKIKESARGGGVAHS
jgi:predicted amino acid dehydrogenase/ribosome-associated toxin RatA of RatAB toxin-antitoxin module